MQSMPGADAHGENCDAANCKPDVPTSRVDQTATQAGNMPANSSSMSVNSYCTAPVQVIVSVSAPILTSMISW